MRQLLSIILFSLSCDAFAEGGIAASFNKIYYGMYNCPAIANEDVKKAGICNAEPELGDWGFRFLKRSVFTGAREIQNSRNVCLTDYLKKFAASKEAQNEYRRKLTGLWLNKKKAEMVVKQCDEIRAGLMQYNEYMSTIRASSEKENRVLTELEYLKKFRPRVSTQFYADCQNHGRITALKEMVRLSPEALPILSTSAAFDVIEKNRDLILSEKTGKPVTDKEILEFDANGTEPFVSYDRGQIDRLYTDLHVLFQQELKDRNGFAKSTSDDFSEAAMRKLFDDGSAATYMNRVGLDETKAKQDKDVARMYYCLKSEYEPNITSDIAEFVFMAALTKSVIPAKFAALVARLGPKTGAAVIGGITSLGGATTTSIYRACFRDNTGRSSLKSGNKSNVSQFDAGKLPRSFDFDFLTLESLPMNSVKACEEKDVDRLVMSTSPIHSCLYEAFYNALPMTLSLPLMVL